jgi:hypothetical protein
MPTLVAATLDEWIDWTMLALGAIGAALTYVIKRRSK